MHSGGSARTPKQRAGILVWCLVAVAVGVLAYVGVGKLFAARAHADGRDVAEADAAPALTREERIEAIILGVAKLRPTSVMRRPKGGKRYDGGTGWELVIECDGTRLPPGTFADFWSTLVHVVRNAVDHGLEPCAGARDRCAGQLTFTARTAAGVLVVSIADSGRGIAWDEVAKKAAARGLRHAKESELVEALFADGMSTREVVTETSGRGVGLSAVRNEVERAGGTIEVESKPGAGTRFVFRLPLVQHAGRHAA